MRLTIREKRAIAPLQKRLTHWKRTRSLLDEIESRIGSRPHHPSDEDDELMHAFTLIRRVLNVEIGGMRGEIERVVGLEKGCLWTEDTADAGEE